ncbi:MAG: hypothetical protein ACOC9Z_09355 [Chloroflexota bacterium]
MKENATSRLSRLCLAIFMALAALFALSAMIDRATQAAAAPQTALIVSNVNDAGGGSLRQAIMDANALPGADVIDITAMGTVTLLSPLPTITDSVTIQGPGRAASK